MQDNTQVEIALFLVSVGGRVDALFLAGDPAQSVVEGVEFRFEEVRSLVHALCSRQEALQRPSKLLVNYRSHSGILNCAGAVLGRMLWMFPGAAKTLPADEGLFLGPRPAYYNPATGLSGVAQLLAGNERLVVLCPDERAADVSCQLMGRAYNSHLGGENPNTTEVNTNSTPNLVMGIRAAKGLEFTDIVLLDFFCSLPDSDYKAWKALLSVSVGEGSKAGQQAAGAEGQHQYAYPQLEPQLKLLYTGITRCINRLIFAESRRSRIGGLFFRWLKQHQLADTFAVDAGNKGDKGKISGSLLVLDGSSTLMTRDEWRMRGIDIALSAQGSAELQRGAQLLGQAVLCFQRADEAELKSVAMAHLSLLQAQLTHCATIIMSSNETQSSKSDTNATTAGELSSAEEVKVASAVLRGLRVGLVGASRGLCRAVEEKLPAQSRKYFTAELLHKFTGVAN